MPRISVVTPCYNAFAFIGRTIVSVFDQSYRDWEHIVVDDGSRDESAASVARLLPGEPRLRLIRQDNGGCARARNVGFDACSRDSEYLLFLDADDCLEPHMLKTMVDYLDAHPDVGMAYCDFGLIDEQD